MEEIPAHPLKYSKTGDGSRGVPQRLYTAKPFSCVETNGTLNPTNTTMIMMMLMMMIK
jgi:hypothetical protein